MKRGDIVKLSGVVYVIGYVNAQQDYDVTSGTYYPVHVHLKRCDGIPELNDRLGYLVDELMRETDTNGK